MKICIAFYIFQILFYLAKCNVIPWPAKEKTVNQYLDHFNFISAERNYVTSFKQRYLYEDKWFKSGGPIFFYCGNEGSIEGFWNNTGFVFELAPKFNALVVFGEHRYYGKSLPFGNKSFQQPNISYLSVEQALADYVYMITDIKPTFHAEKSKVIAFGGSYGGMLAAYLRFKYPNIVDGALAASAPLNWVAGTGNFQQFFQTITRDFGEANASCVPIVRKGFSLMMLMGNQSDYSALSKKLNLCKPITSMHEVYYTMEWIRNAFVMVSMMDYPYKANFMGDLPANPVNVSCQKLVKHISDPIVGLREAAAVFYGENLKCFDPFKLYLECSDITGCGLGPASKAWDFQACTEMNLYDRGETSISSMFPNIPFGYGTVDKYCTKIWEVRRAKDQLRLLNWGGDVSTATNVIYSNGNRDPWSLGGILSNSSLPKSSVALMVQGGAHHLDLRASNSADPVSVKVVRNIEEKYIKMWLNMK